MNTKSLDNKSQIFQQTVSLAFWTAGWVITMAAAVFGPVYLWESTMWLTILVVIINLGFGIGMIFANIRHLNTLDELMRKIHLQAMALALGVGVVGGLTYSVMDVTNIISSDAEIGFLVMMISVTYLLSLFINMRRYK